MPFPQLTRVCETLPTLGDSWARYYYVNSQTYKDEMITQQEEFKTPHLGSCWYRGYCVTPPCCKIRVGVVTNGKEEWINCPTCKKTYKVEVKLTPWEDD